MTCNRLRTFVFATSLALGAPVASVRADEIDTLDALAERGVEFEGYVETNYTWSFGRPSNRIVHYRGFDDRHDTFTLANVALGASLDRAGIVARAMLQAGRTPDTYYLAEPVHVGTTASATSGASTWKFVQEAHGGYRFDVGEGLTVTAGVYLSPIGPESMAVRHDWNWSRSNLFFGLPFYHTGVRLSYAATDAWTVTLALNSGWNSVVDGNDRKSCSAQVTYTSPTVVASLLYAGGDERPASAPEGPAFRHTVDAHVTWHASSRVSWIAHANAGLESNAFGRSGWMAGALYARVRAADTLHIAARIDAFREYVAEGSTGRASPIFWPAPWVSSATATVDVRPHENVSFRLEYRHDHAGAPMYFGGAVSGDGVVVPYAPNRRSQDTITVGAAAWF